MKLKGQITLVVVCQLSEATDVPYETVSDRKLPDASELNIKIVMALLGIELRAQGP
jgi:hypothetical protein